MNPTETSVYDRLQKDGCIFVEDFLDTSLCDVVIQQFKKAQNSELRRSRVGLNDSTDEFNRVYQSNRSPLRYCYLRTQVTQDINRTGKEILETLTGMNWGGNINEVCFPVFDYRLDGYIERHRGRNVGFGRNDFVAVLMLTQYGEDFSGGEFFLNKNAKASPDGKTVYYEDETARQYYTQTKGSVLVFDNRIHVHGTLPTRESANRRCVRMTTSWRMESGDEA